MSSTNFPNPRVRALRILAIETTERQGSIALSESGSLQYHHPLPKGPVSPVEGSAPVHSANKRNPDPNSAADG